MYKLITRTGLALGLILSTTCSQALARGEEPVGKSMLQSAEFFLPWKGLTGYDKGEFSSGAWSKKDVSAKVLKSAVGDLNGDGVDDGAAIYSVERDGNTSYFLGAFVGKRGQARQISYVCINEEANLGDLSISSGNIIMTLKHTSGSDESPELKQTFEYTLEKGRKLKSKSG